MLNGVRQCVRARSLWLTLLLLVVSATSRAQFLQFAEYLVPTANSLPGCIVAGPDDALWFTEKGQFANHIGRVSTAGVFTEYPIPTLNSGPSCIRPGPDGALWFTEANGNKIGRITTSGVITEYNIPTFGSSPSGIKVGPDGAMWFTEQQGNQIGRITTNGTITEYRIPTFASYPVGIAAGPDGALWFTESSGNKIGRITTAGVVTNEYSVPTANSVPFTIISGPDGALWFTESSGNKIGRITTAGVVTNEYAVPTANSVPWGLTNGPDGAIWFIERVANKIARITTEGAITEYSIPVVPGSPYSIGNGPDGAFWLTDDASNAIVSAAIVTQAPPLTVFTNSPSTTVHTLPPGSVGVAYSQTVSATGGTPPYTWAVSTGSLPGGLTLGPTTGRIAGTPKANGSTNFTLRVTDASHAQATQQFSLTIAANGISEFPLPLTYRFGGITPGPDGALWFTERTSGQFEDEVGRITTAGAITEFPLSGCDCVGPNGITAGSDGALWLGYGFEVYRMTTAGAVTGFEVPNGFDIYGITNGPDGALWFTDDSSDYIGRITTAGDITTFPVPGHDDAPDGIYSITTGPDGALWFTEYQGYIGRITTAGVVTEFPVQAVPTAIAAGPDGALWFTDTNGAIGRITTAGEVTEYPTPTADSNPSGITLGPDGALWFTENAANNIGRISTNGAITEYPIPAGDVGFPGAIAAGPDGAVWFTEVTPAGFAVKPSASGGAIGRFLPAPTLTAINPPSGAQGAAVPVVLTGSSFVAGGTTVNVPAGITLTNLNVVSPTQVAVTFTISATAATGLVDVTVTTSSGTSQAVTFTITPPAPSAPSLISINPPVGVQGTSVPVVLTGTNFIAGPTIIGTNFLDNYSQLVPLTPAATQVDNGQLTVTATVYPDPTDPNSQWVDFNFQSVSGGALAADLNALWQIYLSNVPLIVPGTYTGLQYYWTVNGTAAPNITPITGLSPVVPNLINPALGLVYGSTFQGGNPLSLFNVSAILSGYTSALEQGGMNPATINGFHIAARTTGGVFGGATVSVANAGVSVSGVTITSATQIAAVFNVAANAALGPANVAVSTAGGTSTPPPAVTFSVLPPAPTLTSINPGGGTVGTTVAATLTGSNFVAGGTTVNVTGGVTASNVVVSASNQLTVTLSIPATAAPGVVNVTVSTAGGTSGAVGFTVNPVPLITSPTPLPSGAVGNAYSQPVTVTGGTSPYTWVVTAGSLPAGLSLDPATCTGSLQNSCLIVGTPSAVETASFTLKVTDASGAAASAAFGLNINPPSPAITSIKPSSGAQGATVPVTITGTNFVTGASVSVSNSGVTVSRLVVVNSTEIDATFAIAANATVGPDNVVVTTAGGPSQPAVFTVLAGLPVLTTMAPSTGVQGASVAVTLNGANFVTGATIAFSTAGITASNVTVVSSTQITATFIIAANAPLGSSNVTVTTPAGTSGHLTFTVFAPLQISVNPAAGTQGTSVPVTITGAGFAAGAQVTISNPGVTVGNVVVVSATQITATLTIAATASPGPAIVTVSVPGGASGQVTFTVLTPQQISINPASGVQGSSVPVTITGTGFAAGAQIGISNPGVTASNMVVVSATQITATLTIAANASPGAATVTVTVPGGISEHVIFTVLAPPVLTSISPSSGVQGASVSVTLTGTGFVQGAQVSVSNSGVTVANVAVVSSTEITATFNISATAAAGAANVTVTVAGVTTAQVTFTVNLPAPTLTSISAASAPQGSSVAVTLTGTNFVSGATIAAANSGITFTGIQVVSATEIDTTLTIGTDAALGATTITVTTPGGSSAPLAFAVGPPVVFSLTGLPSSISPGQQISFTVSIPEAYPVDLSGVLTLQFTPGQSLPPDPTIALSGGTCVSGTCTVSFQIPASQTSASLSLQTGTVAGTLDFTIGSVTVGATAVTLSNNPPVTASAPAQAPGISNVSIQQMSTGFNIVVTGFSNTREITEADFTFTPTSGSQLQTSTFSLTNVASTFQGYYASDASLAVGSEFVYTQTFNVTSGSISTLQSVTVTLKNTQGASSTVTANF